jgi:nitrogenase molybdenum-cofactor synthesis protein NifE
MPPGIRVQKTMYEFLDPPVKKDRGIIILGSYRPPAQNSELAQVLGHYGFGPLRHPEYCPDFETFREMSQSAAALILRPEGRAAGDDLSSRLGIPALPCFIAFDRETLLERYRRLFTFLEGLDPAEKNKGSGAGEKAESLLEAAAKTAEERGRETASVLGDARVAVDATATAAPFNLALALVKSGINVNRIYANQLPDFEKPSLAELARLKGDIIVANPNHVRKYGPRPAEALADMAVGFEAGYATAAPVTVPLAFDEQIYGFEGYTRILETLIQYAGEGKSDLRQQVQDYGLVV